MLDIDQPRWREKALGGSCAYLVLLFSCLDFMFPGAIIAVQSQSQGHRFAECIVGNEP